MKNDRKKERIEPGLYRLTGSKMIYANARIGPIDTSHALGTNKVCEARLLRAKWIESEKKKLQTSAVGSISEAFKEYVDSERMELALGNKKKSSLENEKKNFQLLLGHCPELEGMVVSDFCESEARKIATHLLLKAKNRSITRECVAPRGLSNATVNSYLAPLCKTLEYLVDKKRFSAEVYLTLKKGPLKRAKVIPRTVELPDSAQFAVMRNYLYRVRQGRSCAELGVKFDFFMLSGARKESAISARVRHFNSNKRELRLTNLKAKAGEPTEKTVAIVDELCEILERYIDDLGLLPDDLLFKTKNNNGAFKSAAKKAGLENWFHHACRKWFGTTTVNETGDIAETANLMNHKDGGVTLLKAYRQACSQHQHRVVRQLRLLPGADGGRELDPIVNKVHKAVLSIAEMKPDIARLAFDRILAMPGRLAAGDEQWLEEMPATGIEAPPKYVSPQHRTKCRPSPTRFKETVRNLMEERRLRNSDVQIGTGLTQSAISRLVRCGDLQACALPELSRFFDVSIEFLLTGDDSVSRRAVQPDVDFEKEAMETENNSSIEDPTETSDCEHLWSPFVGRSGAETKRILATNLRSLLFEQNLTPHALNKRIGANSGVVYDYLAERFLPEEHTLIRICSELEIGQNELFDPIRENITPKPEMVKGNLGIIAGHHMMALSTYAVRRGLDANTLKRAAETGVVTATQAHRIAEAEKLSVRELVMEDLSDRFSDRVVLDPTTIARNIQSHCWETGLTPSEIAVKAGVSAVTGVAYAESRSRRILPRVLAAIAKSMGVTLGELASSDRPAVQVTPNFHSNLAYLFERSECSLTKFADFCRIQPPRMTALLNGTAPSPQHVWRISLAHGLKPRRLLMDDLK